MKLALVFLLGLSVIGTCEAGECAGNCNTILENCACDVLCPLFGDCCDTMTIMTDCSIDPSATTGELDFSEEIFTEGEFKEHLICGSDKLQQDLSNEGSDIWRMYFTSQDASTDRVTVNVCDHHDNLMVSVMKPLNNGDVEDQCGLVRCECTFQPSSAPEHFYIVVYRVEMLDDDADTDLSTDYGISVTCNAEDVDACASSLEDVKAACPTYDEDANTCFNFDVAADCCSHFVDYFDQCGETVSADAGYSTACLEYPGDASVARRCSADQVVLFDTTFSSLDLEDITVNFLNAFRKAMAKTLGIDEDSVLVSDVEENEDKQGGVKIGVTIISDSQTENLNGDPLDTEALTNAVENLDTAELAANTNTELAAEGISTTTSAEDFAISAPQVESAVATPSTTPSASSSVSATSSATPSASPSSSPSPQTCTTLEEGVNDACLTDGCVSTDISVGDDCCAAVTAYTNGMCSGYTFDDSCNTNPATLVLLFSDNCEATTTSGASVPTLFAAAALALVAFAVRA